VRIRLAGGGIGSFSTREHVIIFVM
jgi:hypothetical protein